MLSCIIDGQERTIDPGHGATLSAMLVDLNPDLTRGGRFISSMRVNGEEVQCDGTDGDIRLEENDSVEITTETPLCLVGKILGEAQNYIDGLRDYIMRVAGHFSSGSGSAESYLAEAVQGLQWFVQMTDFIETTLKLDFNSLTLDGRSLTDYVNILNEILMEVVNAQESGDQVLLADVLEYDLAPHLEDWKRIYNLFEGGYAAARRM